MLNLEVALRCTVEQVRISHWMRGPTSPLTQKRPTLYTAEECLPDVLLDPFFAEDAHYVTESPSLTANSVPVSIEQSSKYVEPTCQPSSPQVTVPPIESSSPPFETNPFNGLSLTSPSKASALHPTNCTEPNGASTPMNSSQDNPELPSNPFELTPQATPVESTQNRRKKGYPRQISKNGVIFPSPMPIGHADLNLEPSATNPSSPSEPSCSSEASSAQITSPTKSSPAKPTSLDAPASSTPKTKEVHRRKLTAVALLHQRKRILNDPSSVIITSPTPLVKPTSIRQKISSAGKKLVQTLSKHSPTTE